MELCTIQAISTLPSLNHRYLTAPSPSALRTATAFSLKPSLVSGSSYSLRSRFLYYNNILPKATASEETSSEESQYGVNDRDRVATLKDVAPVEKRVYNEIPSEGPKEESSADEQTFELLDNLNIKFDSEDTYSILLYGSGALVALWLLSAVVGAVDSIPLFPKLMEVVGLGFTIWFTSRYLLFKKNRDELSTKIEELKQQVLGSKDDCFLLVFFFFFPLLIRTVRMFEN